MTIANILSNNPDIRALTIIANGNNHNCLLTAKEILACKMQGINSKPVSLEILKAKASKLSARINKPVSKKAEIELIKQLISNITQIIMLEASMLQAGGNPSMFTYADVTDQVCSNLHSFNGTLN